jgi:hypothetical protein
MKLGSLKVTAAAVNAVGRYRHLAPSGAALPPEVPPMTGPRPC